MGRQVFDDCYRITAFAPKIVFGLMGRLCMLREKIWRKTLEIAKINLQIQNFLTAQN